TTQLTSKRILGRADCPTHGFLMALAEAATVTPERRAGIRGHIFAVSIALIGGLLGIVGAMIQELRAGGFLLLPFLGAPIIEEGVELRGVDILLIRWPPPPPR